MVYTVFGATGKTGRVVAESLLAAGREVRVLVRDPGKASFLRGRAEIVTGDLDDESAVTRALRGADGAYLLSPPNFAADDFLAERRVFVERLGKAIAASGVPHVVLLSSIGAASILAKVKRDEMMVGYDRLYPQYGFAGHKGYGTPMHCEILENIGPSPIHRRSFEPVRLAAQLRCA